MGQPRAADAFQCRRRKRVIGNSYTFKPGDLAVPLKERSQRVECGEGSIDDLEPDSVPGDEGHWNGSRHSADPVSITLEALGRHRR